MNEKPSRKEERRSFNEDCGGQRETSKSANKTKQIVLGIKTSEVQHL